jgi:hypothetical protein
MMKSIFLFLVILFSVLRIYLNPTQVGTQMQNCNVIYFYYNPNDCINCFVNFSSLIYAISKAKDILNRQTIIVLPNTLRTIEYNYHKSRVNSILQEDSNLFSFAKDTLNGGLEISKLNNSINPKSSFIILRTQKDCNKIHYKSYKELISSGNIEKFMLQE